MKYLHLFKTKQEHDTAYQRGGGEYKEPWVAYTEESKKVSYNLPHDYAYDYLTFKALEDGTFKFSGSGLSYSIDNGNTWSELPADTETPLVKNGETISFKGEIIQSSSVVNHSHFSSTCKFEAMGNPYSLIYGDNFSSIVDISGKDHALAYIFENCSNLISAKNLILPATKLSESCYAEMFLSCTALTEAPELTATTLAQNCYGGMFWNCKSLTTAPELPATTLADYCYQGMFIDCASLTTAPELPATTLTINCYAQMFNRCTSLTTAPALPATTLAETCYVNMFWNCTSLSTAPELPATQLSYLCYGGMFDGCVSLIKGPELPATLLVDSCYLGMFGSCTHLNYIKMLATDISANSCLEEWVTGVSESGTFVKNAAMTSLPTGESGIPEGWTVQDVSI